MEKAADFAKVGEKISALIINIAEKERKIGLSIKELHKMSEKADFQKFSANKESATSNLGELIRKELE